jgi:hypothetical protein
VTRWIFNIVTASSCIDIGRRNLSCSENYGSPLIRMWKQSTLLPVTKIWRALMILGADLRPLCACEENDPACWPEHALPPRFKDFFGHHDQHKMHKLSINRLPRLHGWFLMTEASFFAQEGKPVELPVPKERRWSRWSCISFVMVCIWFAFFWKFCILHWALSIHGTCPSRLSEFSSIVSIPSRPNTAFL